VTKAETSTAQDGLSELRSGGCPVHCQGRGQKFAQLAKALQQRPGICCQRRQSWDVTASPKVTRHHPKSNLRNIWFFEVWLQDLNLKNATSPLNVAHSKGFN